MGSPSPGRHLRFETTRWSLVRALDDEGSSGAQAALAILCEIYWYPLYAYVRRQGHPPEDAQDLTQAFFAQLLQRRDLRGLRRDDGRLRSYLLGALRHFLLNQAVRHRAIKRGAGEPTVSLEILQSGERRYASEPVSTALPPDLAYERRWALAVLERVLSQVATQWDAANRRPPFALLKDYLRGESVAGGYETIAREADMTAGAVAVAVHRLRSLFGKELRTAIADTVVSEADVEAELHWLLRSLSTSV